MSDPITPPGYADQVHVLTDALTAARRDPQQARGLLKLMDLLIGGSPLGNDVLAFLAKTEEAPWLRALQAVLDAKGRLKDIKRGRI